ncbi:MAG: CHAP domain-containing protein [Stellaceae bacterium]
MQAKLGWGLLWGALLVSCVAGHSRRAAAGNCALYARAVTGVDLYGAAGGWWDEAAGRYQRGQTPTVGSILVFRPTGAIPSGHVAVVSKIVGPTMVLVDQSNWYHGRVTLQTPVVDTSPNHDWTTVAVMNLGAGQFGRDNPTFGFVYPQSGSIQVAANADTGGFDPYVAASHISYDSGQQPGLFHFAIADDYRSRGGRGRRRVSGRTARYSVRLAAPSRSHTYTGWRSHSAHEAGRHARMQTSETGGHRAYRTALAD